MSAENMKLVSYSQMDNKPIAWVYDADDGWRRYKGKGKMPGPTYLRTYDLTFGGKSVADDDNPKTIATKKLLVLDNYGFEGMNLISEIEDRMVGKDVQEHGWQLAIDRDTGFFYRITYYTERGIKGIIAVISEFLSEYDRSGTQHSPDRRVIPQRHLNAALLSVRTAKRPWNIKFPNEAWASLYSREIGIPEFLSWAVVVLDYGRNRLLEIHPNGFSRDVRCE
jgi:hypothetical protein